MVIKLNHHTQIIINLFLRFMKGKKKDVNNNIIDLLYSSYYIFLWFINYQKFH